MREVAEYGVMLSEKMQVVGSFKLNKDSKLWKSCDGDREKIFLKWMEDKYEKWCNSWVRDELRDIAYSSELLESFWRVYKFDRHDVPRWLWNLFNKDYKVEDFRLFGVIEEKEVRKIPEKSEKEKNDKLEIYNRFMEIRRLIHSEFSKEVQLILRNELWLRMFSTDSEISESFMNLGVELRHMIMTELWMFDACLKRGI